MGKGSLAKWGLLVKMLQAKESQVGQAYATQKPAATGAAELIYNEKWAPYLFHLTNLCIHGPCILFQNTFKGEKSTKLNKI